MSKPNKSEIETNLAELAKLENQRLRVEARRDLDLDPHVTRFQKATRTIQETAQKKLAKLTPKIDALASEISAAMLAGVDADGVIALPQVSVAVGKVTAIAEVKSKDGARVIDAKKYFSHTPPAQRGMEFWKPVKILIAPACLFIGDTVVDSMSDKPTTYSVDFKFTG